MQIEVHCTVFWNKSCHLGVCLGNLYNMENLEIRVANLGVCLGSHNKYTFLSEDLIEGWSSLLMNLRIIDV